MCTTSVSKIPWVMWAIKTHKFQFAHTLPLTKANWPTILEPGILFFHPRLPSCLSLVNGQHCTQPSSTCMFVSMKDRHIWKMVRSRKILQILYCFKVHFQRSYVITRGRIKFGRYARFTVEFLFDDGTSESHKIKVRSM